MNLLGKLSWDAIPYDPIVLGTLAVVAVGGAALFVFMTLAKKWGWLWREWLTSVDHKRLGIMYIILALYAYPWFRGCDYDAYTARCGNQWLGRLFASAPLRPDLTAHGVIMIIFMAMPFMIGLMNIILPLQIGARDVAFRS
ncbi:cbb3-type cytochrome c oxidase subunit I [Marinomonas fungiae]|uniref:cbb3-type cytochrome c oxidase subunit I n=1 Tax=Marinomonas fungiae TaxID=1137284 RepID=UPI003A92068A